MWLVHTAINAQLASFAGISSSQGIVEKKVAVVGKLLSHIRQRSNSVENRVDAIKGKLFHG